MKGKKIRTFYDYQTKKGEKMKVVLNETQYKNKALREHYKSCGWEVIKDKSVGSWTDKEVNQIINHNRKMFIKG